MSNRDEQLEALKNAVKTAESKLKSAEMTAKDIEGKIKSADETFEQKLADKAAGYKEQTGVDFSRIVDGNGKATYSFSREKTEKERNSRRNLTISRQIDSETGEVKHKVEFTDSGSQSVDVKSAKDLKKPKSRKKYIAYNLFGYRKFEFSTKADNPFLNTVGKPIIVPIQAAAKITETLKENAAKAAESSVGKGISTAAKIVSAPVVIPAKIVKDIAEKGGVIHSIVDLGDRIRIEGVNVPKPLKAAGNAVKGVALGTETAAVETVKSMGTFSVEIAKEKIREEINNGISENDSVKAFYVIGMKSSEVMRILADHAQFQLAVIRDKAGNDIKNVNVSRYLAEKEERKFQKKLNKLKNEKSSADELVNNARTEYETAKARLEEYEIKHGLQEKKSKSAVSSPEKVNLTKTEKASLTKTEEKIEKTKKKLENTKEKIKPMPVADLKTTAKRFGGLGVSTVTSSLRQKAIRDGGDNTGVEAADKAAIATRTAFHYGKKLYDKTLVNKEIKYEQKLQTLENLKNFEIKLSESGSFKAAAPKGTKAKKSSVKKIKEKYKKAVKKRQQRKIFKKTAEKSAKKVGKTAVKATAKVAQKTAELAVDVAGGAEVKLAIAAVVLVIVIIIILVFCALLLFGGGGATSTVSQVISPCSTNTLGLCDRYYTELGKNMIDYHQNIEDYYVGYDKYVCLTEIDEITHSPEKLLPYLGVKAIADNGGDEWTYSDVTPYIEELFNEQYEFYTNEIHEVRKNVSTMVYTNEDSYYSALGTSEYNLERPEGANIPEPLKSEWYTPYANTDTHVEVLVADGYIENTLDSVGVFTDKDGNTTEYDEMQTLTFYNYWTIQLIFDWKDDHYEEYWLYTEERQDYYEFDYFILEYAIRENAIDVDGNYWTDTDENWRDNNFDKLIYNRVMSEFDDNMKEQFGIYSNFLMGHQMLTLPFDNPVITKYAGYDNHIYGDTSLDYSMELQTYGGQEIICGMDGDITVLSDNSFSVYNSKCGTLYYDYVTVPNVSKAKGGEVISSATGDTLRITFIDNNGEYLNPLFLFGA